MGRVFKEDWRFYNRNLIFVSIFDDSDHVFIIILYDQGKGRAFVTVLTTTVRKEPRDYKRGINLRNYRKLLELKGRVGEETSCSKKTVRKLFQKIHPSSSRPVIKGLLPFRCKYLLIQFKPINENSLEDPFHEESVIQNNFRGRIVQQV